MTALSPPARTRRALDLIGARPGDIILVHSGTAGAWLNVTGQKLLRLLRGARGGARFSHVMLCIAPGTAIHADRDGVRTEQIRHALERLGDPERFRVFRRPDLDMADFLRLLDEAQRYLEQRYSFVYGRRTFLIGRLIHRNARQTMPYCSELIAAVFRKLGIPLGNRPDDLMLPADIEEACQGEGWAEVTEQYYAFQLPESLAKLSIPGITGDRTLGEIAEGDAFLQGLFEASAKQPQLIFSITAGMTDMISGEAKIRDVDVSRARLCAVHPEFLFGSDAALARRALAALPDALAKAIAPPTPIADGLRAAFATLSEDRAPQEGGPTFAEIGELERQNALLGQLAVLIEAEAVLSVIAKACHIPAFEGVPIGAVSSAEAGALIGLVPALSATEAEALFAASDRLAGEPDPAGEVGRKLWTTGKLRQLLTLLRDGIDRPDG